MKKFLLFVAFFLYNAGFGQDGLNHSEKLQEIVLTKTKINPKNEKPAVFPAGANAFKDLLIKNLRTENISDSSDIHCDLIFVIDKEGNITKMEAHGMNKEFNTEAVSALSQIKEKWIPATINGIPVRSRMRVPLDLKFNNEKETKAYFPAGENAFKKLIIDHLKMKDVQGKKSCTVSFVVEEAGQISKIKAEGTDKTFNKNVERAVSKIRERWIPKFLRGFSVASEVKVYFEIN